MEVQVNIGNLAKQKVLYTGLLLWKQYVAYVLHLTSWFSDCEPCVVILLFRIGA